MSCKLTKTIFAVQLISCLAGCLSDTNAGTPIPDIPFSVIVSGYNPIRGVDKNRTLEVFRDQVSLNARLADYVQLPQEHTVDFSTKRAFLINLGQRNTGGFSVATSGIQEFGDYVMVPITKQSRGVIAR